MGMGARNCRRRHRRRRHRRRHHCLAASWLCCLRGLSAAGLRARLLLGVPAGLRCCGPRRRLHRTAGASLPRLLGACAWQCGAPARIRWRPACWRRPARVRWRPACRRSGRLLYAALPVIRSEKRNLFGQRWPAPSMSVSQLLNVMPIGEADRSKARRSASSTLRHGGAAIQMHIKWSNPTRSRSFAHR
jgi:hypothetical protein